MKLQRGNDSYFVNKKGLKELLKSGLLIVTSSTILLTGAKAKANEKYNEEQINSSKKITTTDVGISTLDLNSPAKEVPKEILKDLESYFNIPADLISYSDLYQVISLNINYYEKPEITELKSLDFIKYFPNLTSLSLYNLNIKDISPLKNSNITTFTAVNTSISNEDLQNLPCDLKELNLTACPYITDISFLSKITPNLQKLNIKRLASLKSLEPIKELEKLNSFNCEELAIVYQDMIDYLKINSIETNITNYDIDLSNKVDQIVSNIINDEMTDDEKIQAITYYVIDNIIYNENKSMDSNEKPLTTSLEGQGVCASYAYFMSVLLQKAEIESYEITNKEHGWTIVEKDGKYYYIDSTNIAQNTEFLKNIFKKYGIGYYYMQDPSDVSKSEMDKYDSFKVIISDEMVKKILTGEENKNFIQKHLSNNVTDPIEIIALGITITILCDFILSKSKGKKK